MRSTGPVTVARVGQWDQVFRMLMLQEEVLDDGDGFRGTSIEVHFERQAREVLDQMIYAGFEHHYSLVWVGIVPQLIELCAFSESPLCDCERGKRGGGVEV